MKYWFKVVYTENCILKYVYLCSLEDCDKGKTNWSSNVILLLTRYGFGYVWVNPFSVVHFKQRLIDNSVQEWRENKCPNRVLSTMYKNLKPEFGSLLKLNKGLGILIYAYKNIRISTHSLRVETACYGTNRLERHDRNALFEILKTLKMNITLSCVVQNIAT